MFADGTVRGYLGFTPSPPRLTLQEGGVMFGGAANVVICAFFLCACDRDYFNAGQSFEYMFEKLCDDEKARIPPYLHVAARLGRLAEVASVFCANRSTTHFWRACTALATLLLFRRS